MVVVMQAMQYREVFHTFNYSAEIGMMEVCSG